VNITLWIIASLLALAFLAAGGMKIFQPREKLAASGMGWTEDSKSVTIKAIGLAEILGAVGLILPAATGIAGYLVPLAATGLAIVMVGAVTTHLKRSEKSMALVNVVLAVLALVVAVGRFGAGAF